MTTLKLDPTTHDLVLGEEVSGEEEIRQNVKVRLLIVKGEILWNTGIGIPFIEEVMAKGTPAARLSAIYRDTILGTPGILSLLEGPDLELDAARKLTVTFRADTDVGELDFSEVLTQ